MWEFLLRSSLACASLLRPVMRTHALYVAIAVVCIHLVDSNFLMPKIVGSQVKINPLIIILGVVVGEMLWGIPGMFLSVPYIAMAKVIFDRVDGLSRLGHFIGR